jgi:hypothetical protein
MIIGNTTNSGGIRLTTRQFTRTIITNNHCRGLPSLRINMRTDIAPPNPINIMRNITFNTINGSVEPRLTSITGNVLGNPPLGGLLSTPGYIRIVQPGVFNRPVPLGEICRISDNIIYEGAGTAIVGFLPQEYIALPDNIIL